MTKLPIEYRPKRAVAIYTRRLLVFLLVVELNLLVLVLILDLDK